MLIPRSLQHHGLYIGVKICHILDYITRWLIDTLQIHKMITQITTFALYKEPMRLDTSGIGSNPGKPTGIGISLN